ncbi:hypothetical protein LINPERPRIM_LOCUS16837 [Linum perenne]
MDDGREFWVYYQYEQLPAICFRCGLIGHRVRNCPHHEIQLDLESRGDWICVEANGEELDEVYLLKQSEKKKWNRKNSAKLPPAVLAAWTNSILWAGNQEKSANQHQQRGNCQSSLVARRQQFSSQWRRPLSATKSSNLSRGEAGNRSILQNRPDRPVQVASPPPSKRRLTYEEKGKAKAKETSKPCSKLAIRSNGGIRIMEPCDDVPSKRAPNQGAAALNTMGGSFIQKGGVLPHQGFHRPSHSMNLVREIIANEEAAMENNLGQKLVQGVGSQPLFGDKGGETVADDFSDSESVAHNGEIMARNGIELNILTEGGGENQRIGTNFNLISISESSREEVSVNKIYGMGRPGAVDLVNTVALQFPSGGLDNNLENMAAGHENRQSGRSHTDEKAGQDKMQCDKSNNDEMEFGCNTEVGNEYQGLGGIVVSDGVAAGDFFVAENNPDRLKQMAPGGGDQRWFSKNINSARVNKFPTHGSSLRKKNEAKTQSLPLQFSGPPSSMMNLDKEGVAEINKALSDVVNSFKNARYSTEVRSSPKNTCPQVPLSELEKAAKEFETRKMMLFGQGCEGIGLNPISVTDGSPNPSDLLSSARAIKAARETDKDDLGDDFIDFEDYADAAIDEEEQNQKVKKGLGT